MDPKKGPNPDRRPLAGASLSEAACLHARRFDRYGQGYEIQDLVRELDATGIRIAGDDPWMTLRTALNGDQMRWLGRDGRWFAIDERRPIGTEISGKRLAQETYRHVTKAHASDRVFHYERAKESMLRAGVRIRGPVTGRTMAAALQGSPELFERYPARGRGYWRWKEPTKATG